MNILIEDVTEDSLSLRVLAGDVVRWQRTLTSDDGSVFTVAGKQFGFSEIKDIWEMYASHRDEDGRLLIPFPIDQQLL